MIDLVGQRFGKLVVYKEGSREGRSRTWWCKCDCGNITKPSQSALTRTNHPTGSCGCVRKEKLEVFETLPKRAVRQKTMAYWTALPIK